MKDAAAGGVVVHHGCIGTATGGGGGLMTGGGGQEGVVVHAHWHDCGRIPGSQGGAGKALFWRHRLLRAPLWREGAKQCWGLEGREVTAAEAVQGGMNAPQIRNEQQIIWINRGLEGRNNERCR